MKLGAVLTGEGHVGEHIVFAPRHGHSDQWRSHGSIHEVGQFRPAGAQLLGHLAPGLAGMRAIGLVERLADRGGNRLQATRAAGRADLEKELKQVSTDHKKLVDAIIAGVPADQVKDRMIELDARRKDLERQLAASPAPDPIRIHPGMATTYRARIGQLIAGLSENDRMEEAKEALRALVEKVELVPVPPEESGSGKSDGRPGLAIHLHGALASLLRLACGLPVHEVVGAVAQTQKAPRKAGRGGSNSVQSAEVDSQGSYIVEELVLVAGAGFEPAAFRL